LSKALSRQSYNITQDPSEKGNLADKNPEKVVELQKRIEQLAKESGLLFGGKPNETLL
jgi:hypothetical protein